MVGNNGGIKRSIFQQILEGEQATMNRMQKYG